MSAFSMQGNSDARVFGGNNTSVKKLYNPNFVNKVINCFFMKTKLLIIAVSLYIILFLVTWNLASLIPLSFILFMLFPFILIGMIYLVLKEKGFNYPELGEKDEWGYLDKKKGEIGLMG
ncbi:MAG: hypothetical protein ACHQIM_16260 [Sphingobacteriales bacterium]